MIAYPINVWSRAYFEHLQKYRFETDMQDKMHLLKSSRHQYHFSLSIKDKLFSVFSQFCFIFFSLVLPFQPLDFLFLLTEKPSPPPPSPHQRLSQRSGTHPAGCGQYQPLFLAALGPSVAQRLCLPIF